MEKVKSRFVIFKKVFVFRKQFPLILAFAVTIQKCQALSLDCAMVDLSDQVFCNDMVSVALSHVKQLENLHLLHLHHNKKMSTKYLKEINCLLQSNRIDLPAVHCTVCFKKLSAKTCVNADWEVISDPTPPKHSNQGCAGRKRKAPSINNDEQLPPNKLRCNSLRSDRQSIFNIPDRYRYNLVSPDWQRKVFREHTLRFVCPNKSQQVVLMLY